MSLIKSSTTATVRDNNNGNDSSKKTLSLLSENSMRKIFKFMTFSHSANNSITLVSQRMRDIYCTVRTDDLILSGGGTVAETWLVPGSLELGELVKLIHNEDGKSNIIHQKIKVSFIKTRDICKAIGQNAPFKITDGFYESKCNSILLFGSYNIKIDTDFMTDNIRVWFVVCKNILTTDTCSLVHINSGIKSVARISGKIIVFTVGDSGSRTLHVSGTGEIRPIIETGIVRKYSNCGYLCNNQRYFVRYCKTNKSVILTESTNSKTIGVSFPDEWFLKYNIVTPRSRRVKISVDRLYIVLSGIKLSKESKKRYKICLSISLKTLEDFTFVKFTNKAMDVLIVDNEEIVVPFHNSIITFENVVEFKRVNASSWLSNNFYSSREDGTVKTLGRILKNEFNSIVKNNHNEKMVTLLDPFEKKYINGMFYKKLVHGVQFDFNAILRILFYQEIILEYIDDNDTLTTVGEFKKLSIKYLTLVHSVSTFVKYCRKKVNLNSNSKDPTFHSYENVKKSTVGSEMSAEICLRLIDNDKPMKIIAEYIRCKDILVQNKENNDKFSLYVDYINMLELTCYYKTNKKFIAAMEEVEEKAIRLNMYAKRVEDFNRFSSISMLMGSRVQWLAHLGILVNHLKDLKRRFLLY